MVTRTTLHHIDCSELLQSLSTCALALSTSDRTSVALCDTVHEMLLFFILNDTRDSSSALGGAKLLVRVRLRSVEPVMWSDHSLYRTTQYPYVLHLVISAQFI
jgi:hypothetical protein